MSWFDDLGIEVLGVSKDSIDSHKKFRDKNSLNFPLLSDPELDAHKKYGVWKEKKMYGKTFMGTERSTFLIGEDGRIEKIFRKVRVPGHVDAVRESY